MKPSQFALVACVEVLVGTAVLIAALALANGCCSAFGTGCKATPPPLLDAGGSDCYRAGLRLKQLECKEARVDFEEFCQETMAQGVPLNPACLATINACTEVDTLCRK